MGRKHVILWLALVAHVITEVHFPMRCIGNLTSCSYTIHSTLKRVFYTSRNDSNVSFQYNFLVVTVYIFSSLEHFGEIGGEKLLSGDEEKKQEGESDQEDSVMSSKKEAPKAVSIQETTIIITSR